MYFRNYGLRKTWLDKNQKSTSSEHPCTSNMVSAPKHCSYLDGSSFSILIIVKAIKFAKVTLSDIQNLKTVR